ncbi:MAG: D-glycero-beta-D-manno-heptose 1-phosphate adenylyltransferase [Candidatus Omnitrophica bacterium]|nr:D-glycero-beta-D-manno-heptose 1-phosphate adenylyltransferase [Candidatus Omnitrophota bacterium]
MINSKIKNRVQLKKILAGLRKRRKKIAFTNGCFDILHYGHVKYLEEAKRHADILIIAVNSDSSVKRLKGNKRPLISLKDRMRVLAALKAVDYVVSFKEDTPVEIIKYLKPDIIIKGADYKIKDIVGNKIVGSYGGSVKRVKFIKGYSVTSLIRRITNRRSK